MNDKNRQYAEGLEAHMDEGGKFDSTNVRDLIQMVKDQHARGLELAKALTACITAMNPPDKGGISLGDWNQRLKAATKQACTVFDGSVKDTTPARR